jgi:hypothetical protein
VTATAPRRRVDVNASIDARTLDTAASLGIRGIRTTIQWNVWTDPRPPAAAFRVETKTQIARARARGFELLLCVCVPPAPVDAAGLTAGVPAFVEFMRGLVRELAPGLTWQLMNEMDGEPGFCSWFGARKPSVTQYQRGMLYAQLAVPTVAAMRSVDPTARIITGGIALDPAPFYQGLAEHMPSGHFDAVAIHSYGIYPRDWLAKTQAIRAVLGTTPLYCTEFGSGDTDDDKQRDQIAAALADNDENHRFDRMYLFTLQNSPTGYGLTRADGTLRPAAELLRNRTAA